MVTHYSPPPGSPRPSRACEPGEPCRDRIDLLNVLLAEGINLGLRKMAEATTTHGFLGADAARRRGRRGRCRRRPRAARRSWSRPGTRGGQTGRASVHSGRLTERPLIGPWAAHPRRRRFPSRRAHRDRRPSVTRARPPRGRTWTPASRLGRGTWSRATTPCLVRRLMSGTAPTGHARTAGTPGRPGRRRAAPRHRTRTRPPSPSQPPSNLPFRNRLASSSLRRRSFQTAWVGVAAGGWRSAVAAALGRGRGVEGLADRAPS